MTTPKNAAIPSGGPKQLLFSIVGVSIIGLLFGFFAAAVLLKTNDSVAKTKDKNPATVNAALLMNNSEALPDDAKTSLEYDIVALQPVITNLAESTSVWIRLEGNLLMVKDGDAKPDELALKLAQSILAYLRTLKLTDLQGAGSLHAISQDLNEIVATASKGQVGGLLISGLVFE